ncbi:MAG: hypothetical protein B6I30_01240 [Desulfobacteraceae bacterium 4572_187]|nr:MAG: hypothetical protein B6I30_01240 [Desulfobacteraceae bacterium 4572_187]
MRQNIDDGLVDEIDGRLDDLFAGDKTPEKPDGESSDIKKYPLKELKAVILSIDWEITDDAMKRLANQVAGLKKRYKDDRIVFMLVQLLGSIGEYIRINKGKSHPDSFKFLNSLFKKLDKVVSTKGLTESEKKKILSVEVNKYKALKANLSPRKSLAVKEKLVKPTVKAKSEKTDMLPIEAFADAMDQIRQLIRSEFDSLREELRLRRERK